MCRFLSPGLLLVALAMVAGQQRALAAESGPIDKGLRVATDGHSFHLFVAYLLPQMANAAGIKDHVMVRGGAAGAFRDGRPFDVLTASPFMNPLAPDKRFNELVQKALKHNPNVRIVVQVSWLASDDPKNQTKRGVKTDWNAATVKRLRAIHEPYLKNVRAQLDMLNKQYGKQVLFVVPVAQAAIALREKILAGKVPGIKTQADLFRDDRGHALTPLMVLTSYCNFAIIYRRSPVGLPFSPALKQAKNPAWDEKLDHLLQELAWDAVCKEPLSGVKAARPGTSPPNPAPAVRK